MRAAIYCRISDDREGAGLGVGRQTKDCRALLDRSGWTLAATYVDNDLSASAYARKVRPAYRDLLGMVRSRAVDVVVAWHVDRLYRRPRELEDLIDLAEAHGVRIATATGDMDLRTSDGRAMARVMVAFAAKESDDKSRRIRRKHLELAEAGKVGGGGRRPFGYEADRVTIRPAEAALIRAGAARALAGESLRGIVRDWSARSTTVTGVAWSSTTVRRVLTSARIAGLREHRGVTTTAVWPAIITLAEHEALVAVLGPGRPADRRERTPRSYLLSGLVYCGRPGCGARMTVQPTAKGRRRYVCHADRWGGCNRCGIDAGGAEAEVLGRLFAALDGELLAAGRRRRPDPDDAVAEILAAEAKLAGLAQAWAAGEVDDISWASARKAMEARLADARRRLAEAARAEASSEWHGRGVELAGQWESMGFDARRAVVVSQVERVTVAGLMAGQARFQPARLSVEWR